MSLATRRALFRAAPPICLAALGGALLAACGGAGDAGRQTHPESGGAPATPGARTGAGSATPAKPPVTLELWLPGQQADADALAPFHRQLAEEAPEIKGVDTHLVTNETMMDRLAAALAAGTPPDTARLKEYRLADLGARGALLPLDRFVAADPAVRLTDFTPQSVEGSRAEAGAASAASAASGTAGAPGAGAATPTGRPASQLEHPLLGLPDSHQVVVLYWNTDLLARAGLDPAGAPTTWEALRRAAQAAASAPAAAAETGGAPGSGGEAARWGMQFYEFSLREQTYCWFMEWVWRAGGEVWARDGRDRTRAALDTPEALRALQFQVDLLHADRTAVPPGTPVPELIANVAQGRVGFWMTTANAALTYERTAPGLRFGVGPLPPDRRDAHQLQHNALSVFKDSRYPDLAYRLLSFRSREDVQARWATEGAWLPVRPALWQRPPFGTDPRWRAIGALVHRAGNRPKPAVPEWEAFTAAILPSLLAAWRGETAPKQALAAAERAANAQLAR